MTKIALGERRLALPAAAASWPRLVPPRPPAGAAGLGEALRGGAEWVARQTRGTRGRVVLVVPDRTRPLPLASWLSRLLDDFDEAGVPPGSRVVVPASGIHAPMTHDELARWVGGARVSRRLELAPHDADGPAASLGTSASGLPVRVHPALVDADALLAIGRVVFHYLAGFGGGRKMLAPGCAARETVLALHRRCLDPDPRRGRHPRARAGLLEGNPVHEAACEVARLFPDARGLHLALDARGQAEVALFGDLVEEHARAARAYGAAHRVVVRDPLEALVVSAGGHPLDRDLVQAHKALDAVAPLLAPGAEVLLVADCRDGVGNPEVSAALARGGSRAIAAELRRAFLVGAHTALALREKTERFRVSLLGALPDEELARSGMRRAASLESWLESLPPRARRTAAVAPEGASALYELEGDASGL